MTVATIVQLGIPSPVLATPLPGQFLGFANTLGLSLAAGSTSSLKLYGAAEEGCPCTGTQGVTHTSSVSSIVLGNVISTGTLTATAVATNTATTAASTETAQVSKLSLLGGLITADAILVKANVGATPGTLNTTDDGTTLTNLVIAGTAIDPAVAENTVIPLPGIGAVTVKAVKVTDTGQKVLISVRGLFVSVTAENSFGLAIGSNITVASAHAGYSRVQPAAYQTGSGTGAQVTGVASSALDDAVGLQKGPALQGCSGSGGVTLQSALTKLSIPGLASATAEQTTAFGGPVGAALVTKTTATVTDASLLGGLITVAKIAAVAQVSRTGTVSTASAAGSGLTGLVVAGVSVPANAAPNLKLSLPGVGYVIVNEQTPSGPSIGRMEVIGLDVSVTQANLAGYPVGARLVLGEAVAVSRHY